MLVFSNNFPNNATCTAELYHQHAEGCLFYTCSVLWLQLREHRPALPAYLAFLWHQHWHLLCLPGISIVPALPQKAFGCQNGKNVTQKSAAQLVHTGGMWRLPFPSAFGHSDTLTGASARLHHHPWNTFAAG